VRRGRWGSLVIPITSPANKIHSGAADVNSIPSLAVIPSVVEGSVFFVYR
jgi:hypothetical protein